MAQPTLILGNNDWAVKSGKLLGYTQQYSTPKYFPREFIISRTTTGTQFGRDGLIGTSGIDVPRIDFLDNPNGALLLEPSRTNLVPFSEKYDEPQWSKNAATIENTNVILPDGTTGTANHIKETTDAANHNVFSSLSATVTSGLDYCYTAFFKDDGSGQQFTFAGGSALGTPVLTINSDGTFFAANSAVDEYSVTPYPNGWFRVYFRAGANTDGAGSMTLNVGLRDAHAGNINHGLYIYGAQFEESAYPTSYIKTESSTVNRTKDFGNNYLYDVNNYVGDYTIFFDMGVGQSGAGSAAVGIKFGSLEFIDNTSKKYVPYDRDNTTYAWGTNPSGLPVISNPQKLAFRQQNSGTEVDYFNNGAKITPTYNPVAPTNLRRLILAQTAPNLLQRINEIRIYETAMTDAELIELTS